MGVGKTIQALAVACVYKADWPLLIICPSSLVSFSHFISLIEVFMVRGNPQMVT